MAVPKILAILGISWYTIYSLIGKRRREQALTTVNLLLIGLLFFGTGSRWPKAGVCKSRYSDGQVSRADAVSRAKEGV